MEGPEHDRGVNLRALSTILHLSATDDNYVTDVSMSMLEVYNEKIRYTAEKAYQTTLSDGYVLDVGTCST